jgi:alkanesulfonate monooxygenase SsuD/methylene tetrahydromethanopterin reductase-like flavin-dependent oxidoreductase (luciferase family)
MRFGIFDHLDDGGVPLSQLFEERLKLIEAYDRAGFYGYHLAEHHATPLGYAPSPGVFLSAVAQRTHQLRFGPMVYLLPLYHPLRLIEEICMLDQLSGGRFLFGVGRGISPVEVGLFGVDFAHGMAQYEEALAVIRQGLTQNELTYHGKFYKFDAVPIVLKPAQLPHPPLWYGISRPETIPWAAENDVNLVSFLRPVSAMRPLVERFQAEWTGLGKQPEALPCIGVTRHVVVAETEKEARNIAARAYRPWRRNMEVLWEQRGVPFPLQGELAEEFDVLQHHGVGFAGTPAQARDYIAGQTEGSGINYFVCDMAFGDITFDEAKRSIELFAKEVMPDFAEA